VGRSASEASRPQEPGEGREHRASGDRAKGEALEALRSRAKGEASGPQRPGEGRELAGAEAGAASRGRARGRGRDGGAGALQGRDQRGAGMAQRGRV